MGDFSILGGHGSSPYAIATCRSTTTLYLRISENKKINVVNL